MGKGYGQVFITTDVLDAPHWGIGASFRLVPALFFLPPPYVPFCLTLVAPKTNKLAPPMAKSTSEVAGVPRLSLKY